MKREKKEFFDKYIAVDGKVIQVEEKLNENGELSYFPVVEYWLERGKLLKWRSKYSTNTNYYNIGDIYKLQISKETSEVTVRIDLDFRLTKGLLIMGSISICVALFTLLITFIPGGHSGIFNKAG